MNIQIERRLYPRYAVQWPVEVFIPDHAAGASFDARLRNLSRGGVQIDCDRALVESLLAQHGTHPLCELCIVHPDEPGAVEARCRLVVNRRIAQDSYQLGLKFLQLSPDSTALLERYLGSLERAQP